jgi:hypothetical protein
LTVGFLRFIEGSVLTYLAHQIGSGSPAPTKNALQDLCKLYRRGYRIHPDELYHVQATIMGLSPSMEDPKVQRWVLNSLAQIGDARCRSTITSALEAHAEDPEIVTAGVAALLKLSQNPENELRRLNFPGQIVTLAALQHVKPEQINLSALPVDVEKAVPETIKAALVVVGLDRAPSNLFHPRYSNAEIVKVLGKHDDAMVSQYSVWAITENPSLGVSDLGVDLRNIDGLPKNVRGWVYRLLAMSEDAARKHLDLIEHGSKDDSVEARSGLALGLRDTFFDQLATVVLNWLTIERDPQVRQNLLDHVITHTGRSPIYAEHAVDAYQRARASERERMRGTAAKTLLFPTFRQIDYRAEGDLFVTNNTFNFTNSQVGALAGSGTATNSGQFVQYQQQTVELLRGELARAETTIEGLAIPEADRREIASAIAEAKADPNSGTLARLTSMLTKATGLVTAVSGAEDTLKQIIQGISTLAGFN